MPCFANSQKNLSYKSCLDAVQADLSAVESQMSTKATQAQLQDVMSLARDALQRAQEACNAQGQQARMPDNANLDTGYASGRSSPTQAPSSPKAAYTTPATRGELAMLSRQVRHRFICYSIERHTSSYAVW